MGSSRVIKTPTFNPYSGRQKQQPSTISEKKRKRIWIWDILQFVYDMTLFFRGSDITQISYALSIGCMGEVKSEDNKKKK